MDRGGERGRAEPDQIFWLTSTAINPHLPIQFCRHRYAIWHIDNYLAKERLDCGRAVGGEGSATVKRQAQKRNSEATQFARNQRATANEFASDAWQMPRNRSCCSEKLRREYVIEPYMVDFCCIELKLVVEIDGERHFADAGKSADKVREQFLMRLGYKAMRIPGYEMLRDPQSVKDKIAAAIHNMRGY